MKKFIISCPLLILFLAGCVTTNTPVIVHRYDYSIPPAGLSPGTPPSPPHTRSAAPNRQKIYESSFDNSSLVIFKNDSYQKVKIDIDGGRHKKPKKPIVLEAYQATPDLRFDEGSYKVRILIERLVADKSVWRLAHRFTFQIRPEGRTQIFHIYDPSLSDNYYGYTGSGWFGGYFY